MTDVENPELRLGKRLQHLEQTTTELSAEGRATRADIEKLTRSFDKFSDDVTRWMQQAGRPNVGWLLGGASLIITIMTLAASPFLRDLSRVEDMLGENTARLNGVLGTRWSNKDQESYAEQMRDQHAELDRRSAERRKGMDEAHNELARLFYQHDRDVSALNEKQTGRIKALEDRLEAMQAELLSRGEWMRATDVERAAADARYEAQLKDLTREIREISAEQRRRTTKVYKEEVE